jgi:protocatechuate 3,4-dioxygenase beta subunit
VSRSFTGLLIFPSLRNKKDISDKRTDCDDPITPTVPVGPFYKDEKMNRMAIAEHKQGVPVEYRFIVEDKHCNRIKGAIVDIWQCDADGVYSDYKVENTLNETWLRGYQYTDHNGECRFHSIFPGWYTGRLTHLHAKVHVNGETALITNFFFPKATENEIYTTSFYTKGVNPVHVLDDFELRVDKDTKRYEALIMQMDKKGDGYVASYKIALDK